VPYPHPLITEILYAVPGGDGGDASGDGKRDAAGDEFVELINPHDRPIQLFGYSLTDSQEPGRGQMKFTFPAFELPAGAVAVVFNGYTATWSGPTGDSRTPPGATTPGLGDAFVFTMKATSSRVALGNSGDHVLLTAPDGVPVQRVHWSEGTPAVNKPKVQAPGAASRPAPLVDDPAPVVVKGSVQRDGIRAGGRFVPHSDAEGTLFSPGVHRVAKPPVPVPVDSAPKETVKPAG
jgi:hypothetical protein